jgi:esterase
MAQDILDTLDARGIEQAILLGHSMGGKAVMELALNHPDRVKALIVADMAPRAYPPHHEAILKALQAVQINNLTSRQEAEAQMAPHLDDVGMRQFLLKSLYRTEAGGFAWRFNLRVLTKDYDRILDGVNGIPYQGPTFFISGGNSRYVQDKDHTLIEQFFPSVQYQVLDGAGHWLHAEQPNPFGLAVEGFLAQLD